MGRHALGWRAIMRAEQRRRMRRIVGIASVGVGAIAAGIYGVVVSWPW